MGDRRGACSEPKSLRINVYIATATSSPRIIGRNAAGFRCETVRAPSAENTNPIAAAGRMPRQSNSTCRV